MSNYGRRIRSAGSGASSSRERRRWSRGLSASTLTLTTALLLGRTFFGGNDASWASPTDQAALFKDMVLFVGQNTASTSGAVGTLRGGAAAALLAAALSCSVVGSFW